MKTVPELQAAAAQAVDKAHALASLDVLTAEQETEYKGFLAEADNYRSQIERRKAMEAEQAKLALPVGRDADAMTRIFAKAKTDPYEKDPSLILGGLIRLCAQGKGDIDKALAIGERSYSEGHPVVVAMAATKALSTGTGVAGGFTVPPDFVDMIVPLLYAKSVIRKAGAISIPMPNGTMTIPKMTSGATASWVGEGQQPAASQPGFGQIVATAHKLMALVPLTNDLLRYATPQLDAKVRDDMVMQITLAEDIAFVRGLGTQFSPKGLKSFALSTQTLTSTFAYTLTTVNNELAGLVNKLESANIPMSKPGWLMHPRTKNYLMNLQNSLGLYVYQAQMQGGNLLGIPFYTTTQIPTNLTVNSNANCSEIYLVDFAECMILEGRSLEFAISTEGSFVDTTGSTVNAFAQDMVIIRALLAEDFQLQHNEAVAFDQGVAWAPALQ